MTILTPPPPSDLQPIRDRVKVFHEHISTEGYVEEEGDLLVASGLVDDLLDLALEYQVSSGLEHLLSLWGH